MPQYWKQYVEEFKEEPLAIKPVEEIKTEVLAAV